MTLAYTAQNSQYVDDGEPWQYLGTKGFRQKLGIMKSPINHFWDDEDRGPLNTFATNGGGHGVAKRYDQFMLIVPLAKKGKNA
jgi:hypothetical protein